MIFNFATVSHGQTFELLHSFNFLEGANPYAKLAQGSDGNFYGTTYQGGAYNYGTVFKMTTNGGMITLVTFDYSNGTYPRAGLVQGSDANFYGTTEFGGAYNRGTIFKMATNGALTTLVSFNTNGANPYAGLVQGTDGNFYGTTSSSYGNVFRMSTNGTFAVMATFNNTNGYDPRAVLLEGADHRFYGTTYGNVTLASGDKRGTVFRMTTNGALTTLFSFTSSNTNGSYPESGLVRASDGNFYGTTRGGGVSGAGTVFRMTTNGALTTLVSFNFTNGETPTADLVRGRDGNFYGTTLSGGASDVGTVFRMTTNGVLTTLVSFDTSNGRDPYGLMEGADGNLYGTTHSGGMYGRGNIFRIVMPSLPKLNSTLAGNQIVLSWPTNAVGFTLESATSLFGPTYWIEATNTPSIVGAEFTVTNTATEGSRFYRLRK